MRYVRPIHSNYTIKDSGKEGDIINIFELISFLLSTFGPIRIVDTKKTTSEITAFLVGNKIFQVAGGAMYVVDHQLLIPVKMEEIKVLIRGLMLEGDRINVSSSQIEEAIERTRDSPDLQIDIEDIMQRNEHMILVRNGVLDISTGDFKEVLPKDHLFLYGLNFK